MAIEAWDESPVRLKQHLLELEARVTQLEALFGVGKANAQAEMQSALQTAQADFEAAMAVQMGPAFPSPAPEAPRDPDPGAILA